ncbi:hypothetical protein [Bradyrhizobium sp. WD16]|uniref:hypothetical protein n=1 Tax=Bradyrhizobium sp. WD16 TaxID=1521768 RepID=UPI0020A424D3|nr:hypothetical protein [Bradyrhizobium sp. WD16]
MCRTGRPSDTAPASEAIATANRALREGGGGTIALTWINDGQNSSGAVVNIARGIDRISALPGYLAMPGT